ncbi:hypothetical protein V8E53_002042 [Lactarius tabidus]
MVGLGQQDFIYVTCRRLSDQNWIQDGLQVCFRWDWKWQDTANCTEQRYIFNCLTLSPLRCLQNDFRTRFQTRDHPVLHTNFLWTCKGLERELVQKSGSNLFRSSDLGGATNEHEPRALPLRHAPCQHNESVISLWISLTVHPLSERTYFAIEGARLDLRATCTPFKNQLNPGFSLCGSYDRKGSKSWHARMKRALVLREGGQLGSVPQK